MNILADLPCGNTTTARASLTGNHPLWSKPGPVGSWEQLVHRELRIRRMVELLAQGLSYRSIAKEMGLARTTVMRMKRDAASCSAFTAEMVPSHVASMCRTT